MKLKIDKNKKVLIISIIGILIIVFTVVFPTFARFQNRTSMQGTTVWDGITVANSFRKGNGSINNPYIISNGSELAYFEKKLEEENIIKKEFTPIHSKLERNNELYRQIENSNSVCVTVRRGDFFRNE